MANPALSGRTLPAFGFLAYRSLLINSTFICGQFMRKVFSRFKLQITGCLSVV